jgi:hypothetical protein
MMCSVRKAQGYTINLKAERETIAAKNAAGEPMPLTEFANFLPFDSEGNITFVQKALQSMLPT